MIAVAGGNGRLGREVVRRLTERGFEIRVLTRDPGRAADLHGPLVEVVRADVEHPETLEPALRGVRVLISAITGFGPRDAGPETVDFRGNLALFSAAKAAAVEHVVLLSVAQASPDAPIGLFRAKHRAEEALRSSGLAWTILRPTAYMETYIELVGRPLVETGRTRVFGRGDNPINFVSARDVAGFVELAAVDPTMRGAVVEIPGPRDISLNELAAAVERVTGAKGRIGHTPLPVMRGLSVLLRPFRPRLADIVAAAIVLDTHDMRFDPSSRGLHAGIPATNIEEVIRQELMPGEAEPGVALAAGSA